MIKRLAFLLALACGVCIAHASPVATVDDGEFSDGFPEYIQDEMTGKWTVNIDVVETGPCCGMEVYLDSTSSIVIERINITASNPYGSSSVQLIVRGESLSGPITSVESVNYYLPGGSRLPSTLNLTIDLDPSAGTGRIGNGDDMVPTVIEAHRINRISARSLEADIITIGEEGIRDLIIDGDIGSSTNEVTIDTDGEIEDIQAKNIYADIDADNVESIRVFGSGSDTVAATDAVFAGSLTCNTFDGSGELGLRIWGDLEANVVVADEIVGIINRIAVGRELIGDITIGAGGLGERGITIGWMPTATGVWTGDITVGTTTLSPKGDYTQTGLGDGGVGLAPYGLYKQACDPPYIGSAWATIDVPSGGSLEEVNLVHYNFISDPEAAPTTPFEVTWATGDHCSGPLCIHGANYDASWDFADDAYPLTDPMYPRYRTMRLEGFIEPNKHYHVVVDGTLECSDLFGGGTGVATKPYVYVIYGY